MTSSDSISILQLLDNLSHSFSLSVVVKFSVLTSKRGTNECNYNYLLLRDKISPNFIALKL